MERVEFKKKRIAIEVLLNKISDLLEKNDINHANELIKKVYTVLSSISDEITGNKIQERSVINLRVKCIYLEKQINKKLVKK